MRKFHIFISVEERITYWRELSDYDLETAEAMLKTKRYLYVGFMCHQVVEKIFKAYYTKLKSSNPPFIHGLAAIAEKGGFYAEFTKEQYIFIDQLQPMNIETRYPPYKERLMRKLTAKKCEELLVETKKLHQWIKLRL